MTSGSGTRIDRSAFYEALCWVGATLFTLGFIVWLWWPR